MLTFYPAFAAVAAYLVGSVAFAILVSRAFGLNDPRTYGSGNPGATNVLRSGHKGAAGVTLLLDGLKGYVPVLLVQQFGAPYGLAEGTEAMVALAAFLGHLWPVFFKFKGGKGVATAAGAIFGLNPLLGLATLATWVIIAAFFRYSSLAALVSAVFAPFYQLLFWGAGPAAGAIALMGLLLVWRHTANIQKLLRGTESRIGQKKADSVAAQASTAHAPHKPAPAHKNAPNATPKHAPGQSLKHGHKGGTKQ